eukprot:TRINITY_DN81622_c0_g1_i1.p1 TRINITY_DN81622_c0_g1~~TRINITY_DN81622_c0_g1_i1.p1  ORF type:complete len:799 (+),score=259.03 TRINITY_DN81622_c0_g1_i1:120-2516(+)
MQVAVASGAWRHGSIISVRLGEVRRQAALQCDTCLRFPTAAEVGADLDHMQVDIFARTATSRVAFKPGQQLYELQLESDGFSSLSLRILKENETVHEEPGSASTSRLSHARSRLEDALATDDFISHRDLVRGSPQADSPLPELLDTDGGVKRLSPVPPEGAAPGGGRRPVSRNAGSGGSGNLPPPLPPRSESAAERLQQVQQAASNYIERHELRQILQDMFQKTIKEQPGQPLAFMRELLLEQLRRTGADCEEASPAAAASRSPEAALPVAAGSEMGNPHAAAELARLQEQVQQQRLHVEELTRQNAELEEKRRQEAELTQSNAQLAAAMKLKIDEVAKKRPLSGSSRRPAGGGSPKRPASACMYRLESATEAAGETPLAADQRREIELRYEQKLKEKQLHVESLQKRLATLEATVSTPADAAAGVPLKETAPAGVAAAYGSSPPATASTAVPLVPPGGPWQNGVQVVGLTPPGTAGTLAGYSTGMSLPSTAGAATFAQPLGATLPPSGSMTLLPEPQAPAVQGLPPSPSASALVNTHMLSQLLASSYAPPVPPTTFYEKREDEDGTEDTDGRPLVNTELLIKVVDCKDKSANGVYAWVGECNKRALFRLLGSQPRYLYYAAIDPAWQGWWVADKMGSSDYVEWFSQPSEATLPIYCRKGELGSRIVEVGLNREILQKISEIDSQDEKAAIRRRLMEAFGAQFSKLDGSQRGLMSKTSPVVAVAHALEAQQRAIQLLHGQLALETQHREAAEMHASTMEEAFETLHLRIQAQLPGGGGLAAFEAPAKVMSAGIEAVAA